MIGVVDPKKLSSSLKIAMMNQKKQKQKKKQKKMISKVYHEHA